MAAFEYRALDATGRAVKGVIEGDADRQVRARLRQNGLIPLEVQPIVPASSAPGSERVARGDSTGRRAVASIGPLGGGRLGQTALAVFTRQFATLVRAGLTVEESLALLTNQSDSARLRRLLAAVRARLLEGQSLAASLAVAPHAFPDLYRAMVAAGEQSGRLSEVLERLADYIENREALRQRMLLSLIYPLLVTLVAVTVVTLLLVYVVPQVARVFEHSGQSLPWLTRALIALSDFVRASGWLWLVAIAALAVLGRLALRQQTFARHWQAWTLRLPLYGRLRRALEAARFADTLGILVASGVPLLASLQATVKVIRLAPMQAALEQVWREVREGGGLARALGRHRLFPPLLVHLTASGESSGRLETMLARAAEALARETDNWLKAITALLEPLLILLMGAVVLFVVLAILLPIFQMNQLILR
jgi:general secretion pathway protein F